jgi:HTH-type transcriptional regulator/antitoxin HigA
MDIRPIATESDYGWALAEVERYFDAEPTPGTPEADRFNVLSALIENYEAKHWPIEAPDPIEALSFRMEQAGYTQTDLARLLGSRSRASEILARKRALTMEQAYKLFHEWHIPAEVLIRPYHLT